MRPDPESRGSHPCLHRTCGHSADDHVATPELAGPRETVVWCVACRQHETRRPRRWFVREARPRDPARRLVARGAS